MRQEIKSRALRRRTRRTNTRRTAPTSNSFKNFMCHQLHPHKRRKGLIKFPRFLPYFRITTTTLQVPCRCHSPQQYPDIAPRLQTTNDKWFATLTTASARTTTCALCDTWSLCVTPGSEGAPRQTRTRPHVRPLTSTTNKITPPFPLEFRPSEGGSRGLGLMSRRTSGDMSPGRNSGPQAP